ncbi:MAG: hypothetical protein K2L21_03435 [Muribaculaceae bacterium]|nr:hypothetical protein [Muribaculaceae bacterium]
MILKRVVLLILIAGVALYISADEPKIQPNVGEIKKRPSTGRHPGPSSTSWNIYYDGEKFSIPGLLAENESATVTIHDAYGTIVFLGEITGDDPTIDFSPQPGVYTITLFIPCEGEFSGDILIV